MACMKDLRDHRSISIRSKRSSPTATLTAISSAVHRQRGIKIADCCSTGANAAPGPIQSAIRVECRSDARVKAVPELDQRQRQYESNAALMRMRRQCLFNAQAACQYQGGFNAALERKQRQCTTISAPA